MGVHHRIGSKCTLDHCGEAHEVESALVPDGLTYVDGGLVDPRGMEPGRFVDLNQRRPDSLTEEDLAEIERTWQPAAFCSTDASDAVRLVAEVRRLREQLTLCTKQRDQAEADRAMLRAMISEARMALGGPC